MADTSLQTSSRRLRSLAIPGVLALIFAAAAPHPASAAESWAFEGLKPGKFVVHRQAVPIRVVLIGFEKGQVDEKALESWLPETYAPLVRFPQFYGLNGRDMGIKYRFNYSIVRKDRRFTNSFFDHLGQIGKKGRLTQYQRLYNNQDENVLNITGPVLYIDAASVEQWLDGVRRAAVSAATRSTSSTGTAAAISASTSTPRPTIRTRIRSSISVRSTRQQWLPGAGPRVAVGSTTSRRGPSGTR